MTVGIVPEEQPSLESDEWTSDPLERDESIGAVFAKLVDSGKDYAHAEANRQRSKAGLIASAASRVALLLGIAIMLAFASIVALLVGLIIALSPKLSPMGATAAVVAGTLVIVIMLILVAKSKIGKTKRALKS